MDCYIYDHLRTPRGRGKADGSLHQVTALQLLTQVLEVVRDRNSLDTRLLDDVIAGCNDAVNEQGADITRSAIINANYAQSVPGVQINRFCGSGLEAVDMMAAKIMAGQCELGLAGGVESMSRVPLGSSNGALGRDPTLTYKMYVIPQGISADLIATKYGFSRRDVDSLAVESQRRAALAWQNGYFAKSVITVHDQVGKPILSKDEHLRPDTTLETLAALKPSFAALGELGFDAVAVQRYPEVESINHVHHPGNSSGIVDGSALVLLGSKKMGNKIGLKPRARIRAFAAIGSEPSIMLTGPEFVTQKILKIAKMQLQDIDLFEVNEAFAAVVLRYLQAFSLDPAKVNVNGGAIALGHPIGATGAILVGTLLDELERRNLNTGLVTLCTGGGMGVATIIERV